MTAPTCCWAYCERPPRPGRGMYFCAEHAARISTAQLSTRPTLDAEPTGGEQ